MEIIIAQIVVIIGAWLNAIYDSKRIKSGQDINHKVNAGIRLAIILAISALVYSQSLIIYINTVFLLCVVFWISFDLIINLYLDRYEFQLGKTANTDKFLRWITKNDEYYAFFFKMILLLLSYFSFLIVYDNFYYGY